MMKALVVLLAVAGLTSALPTYMENIFSELQKDTGQQCALTRDGDTVCRSAHVVIEGKPVYAHVCPDISKSVRYYCLHVHCSCVSADILLLVCHRSIHPC